MTNISVMKPDDTLFFFTGSDMIRQFLWLLLKEIKEREIGWLVVHFTMLFGK
jgi:hypothetical protein